jgi:hypothetical protein
MFTKRHEQELAEIKALTIELGQRCHEILEELGRIRDAQTRLAARDRAARSGGNGRGRGRAELARGAKAAPKAAKGAKKPRARQAPQPVRAKQTKRRGDGARKRRGADLAPRSDSDE